MIFLVNFFFLGGGIFSKIQLITCYIHGSLTLFFSWKFLVLFDPQNRCFEII